jgi:transposase
VAPYLTLMTEVVPQRRHDLREVFNSLRWIVRTGAQWPGALWALPTNVPPWAAAGALWAQPTQRWIAAGCFDVMFHDLRALRRWTEGGAKHARERRRGGLRRPEGAPDARGD